MRPSLMRLSLQSKARLACAIVVAGFISLGVFAVSRLELERDQARVMDTVWTPRARIGAELADAARDYRISEALLILSVSPDMMEHADSDQNENAELFGIRMADYKQLLAPGEANPDLDQVARAWQEYLAGNEQMRVLAHGGKPGEAADRFRNSSSRFYMVTSRLKSLADADIRKGSQASALSASVFERGRLQILLTILGSAFVLFVAMIFLDLRVWRAIVGLSGRMVRLANADFSVEIPEGARHDEIGAMARAVQIFKENGLEMSRLELQAEAQRATAMHERAQRDESLAAAEQQRSFVVASLANGMQNLSAGNLAFRLTERFAPEYRKIEEDFNAAMVQLHDTMGVIAGGAAGIRSGTEELSQASEQLARRTESQAATLEEAAAAMAELTATLRTSADGARRSKQAVAATKAEAEQSGAIVRGAVTAMGEIERSARQISDIIGVMDQMAFQTNLLALNAGIEAARAGEAGRGFAVVASEVQALAQRSTVAAKEIKTLISSSSELVATGVDLVGQTGKALGRIVAQVADVNETVGNIATATEEQSNSLLQINSSVTQMDKITQQNAAMAQEGTAASHTLAREADDLARLIARFKVDEPALASPPVAAPPRPPAKPLRPALRSVPAGTVATAWRPSAQVQTESWEEF